MNRMPLTNWIPFNNILYIGDEPKTCLNVIERFNARLVEIESGYKNWFNSRRAKHRNFGKDKLQNHIHYHFEGGIAIFKFRDEEELPIDIRRECINACRSIAFGQLPVDIS